MDIKFKKTALDDDALIYQRSKDTTTKEDIKSLPLRQRLGYFRDYYLKIVVVAVLSVIVLASILNTTVFNRSESELSICFLNGSVPEKSEDLDSFFEEYIGLENKNDYIRSESFFLDNYQMDMAFKTKLMAGAIDLVICSYDDFMEQSEARLFCDLREFLPEDMYDQLSELLVENKVPELDDMGEITAYSDPIPMGIDLSGSSLYKEYGGTATRPVLCAAGTTKNKENALTAIACFCGISGE